MAKQNFDVFSPDGFPIHPTDTYKTKKEAESALKQWVKRYETQGYYSSVKGRISLKDLPGCCKITRVIENN